MHFLHILPYTWEYGGPSKVVFDLTKHQIEEGHKVTVLTLVLEGHKEYEKVKNVQYIYAKSNFFTKILPLFSVGIWNELKFNGGKYDVIHLHLLWNFSLFVSHYFKLHSKTLVTIHGSAHPYTFIGNKLKRWLFTVIFQKKFLKNVKLIHLLHEAEKNEVEEYLKTSIKNYCIVPNGIEFKEVTQIDVPKRNDILFLGRLHQKKGIDLLLPAFKKVLRKLPSSRLILAGPDYGMLTYINGFINENNLKESIIYVGSVSGEVKEEYLKKSKVFVLTSYSEGFSISVLEALSYGLPVVVSNETGLSREIVEYSAGEVVEFNINSISDSLFNILNDESIANKYRNNGLKLIKEKFETNLVTKAFLKTLIERFR